MLQLMGVSIDHEDAARLLCVHGREEVQAAALSELPRSPLEVITSIISLFESTSEGKHMATHQHASLPAGLGMP